MSVTASDRLRLRLLFGMLGTVPVFLVGWLGWLQVVQAGQLNRGDGLAPLRLEPEAADVQQQAREILPAPRGTIVDRTGAVLAIDREVYEVRADVKFKPKLADGAALDAVLERVAGAAADALARGEPVEKRQEARSRQLEVLRLRLRRAFLQVPAEELQAMSPAVRQARLAALPEKQRERNVLLGARVESLDAIEALRRLGAAKLEDCSVWLHFQRGFARFYPDHEVTAGIVGIEAAELQPLPGRPELKTFVRAGKLGLETLGALQSGDTGERSFLRDASRNRYWDGAPDPAEPPKVLHTSIDLELQKYASNELTRQVGLAAAEGKTSDWGALVLVDIQSGDVLAMASYHAEQDAPAGAAFTPYQLRYEPGSVVKPLVLAFALEKNGLDWERTVDCNSAGSEHTKVFDGRAIHDDHGCGILTPHDVLVQSSNIGAVTIGREMDRALWHDYLDFYFHLNTDLERANQQKGVHLLPFQRALGIPLEATGYANSDFRKAVNDVQFRRNTAASLSFGYELQVTAVQLARAYLALLSGRQRNVRLCTGVEIDGTLHAAPPPAEGREELSLATRERIFAAMVDVVSEADHATGGAVLKKLRKEDGVELHGLVAGKTGTAVSTSWKGKGKQRAAVRVRNASFVGVAPANAPRYLAVGVLQKEGNARFYGGEYAAPPVVRLLLHAMRVEERRQLRQEPSQVSVTPGESGWSRSAPETGQAGR